MQRQIITEPKEDGQVSFSLSPFLQIEFHSWKFHTCVSTRMVLQAAKHCTFNYSKCELKSVNDMKTLFHCTYNSVFLFFKMQQRTVRHFLGEDFQPHPSFGTPWIEKGEKSTNCIVNEQQTLHTCMFILPPLTLLREWSSLLERDEAAAQYQSKPSAQHENFNLRVQIADFLTSAGVFLDPVRKCTMPLAWVGLHATNIWSVGLLME